MFNIYLHCCHCIRHWDSSPGKFHLSTQDKIGNFFSRCGVEHVDEDEAEGDEEDNPGGDDVGGDEEGDPGHGDEHGGGQVDGEDEGTQRTRELHLKSVHRVVACKKTSYLFLN